MSKKKSSSNNSGSTISINKLSFWLIVSTAILYLVAMVLHLVGVNSAVVGWLQAVASAVMICIVAVLAWRYVAHKQAVWKVLYFVVLLVILVCIVIPIVL